MGSLQKLKSHESCEGEDEKHEEDAAGVEDVFVALLVGDLHVVPVDVGGLVGLADFDLSLADGQEAAVLLVLVDEVVSEVLVLEGDEGLAGEVAEVEGRGVVEGELLAHADVLLVEDVDLVGDVGHEVGPLDILIGLILLQVLVYKLISELI